MVIFLVVFLGTSVVTTLNENVVIQAKDVAKWIISLCAILALIYLWISVLSLFNVMAIEEVEEDLGIFTIRVGQTPNGFGELPPAYSEKPGRFENRVGAYPIYQQPYGESTLQDNPVQVV